MKRTKGHISFVSTQAQKMLLRTFSNHAGKTWIIRYWVNPMPARVRDVTKAKTGRTKRRDFSLTKLNVNKNPALYYQNAKKKKNQLHCKSQCPF